MAVINISLLLTDTVSRLSRYSHLAIDLAVNVFTVGATAIFSSFFSFWLCLHARQECV